uniref:Uncharacterized protein n=1 Tax=Rhizophora mucronata TaxID=61149 RepID=A0A2P2N3N3_RHIMU
MGFSSFLRFDVIFFFFLEIVAKIFCH